MLSTILQAAVDGERLEKNPAKGVKIATPKGAPKPRVAFSANDLVKIVGALPAAEDDPALHWLPLVALFTGARLAELVNLRVADIEEQGGIPFLRITPEAGSLKTSGSNRRIPLHPDLLKLGFGAFVAERHEAGDARLFPGLGVDATGKRLGRYLRKAAKILDKRKTFHSFRHGFRAALREAGVGEEVADALLGHSGGGTGRTYGDEAYPLAPLALAVAKLSFPLGN